MGTKIISQPAQLKSNFLSFIQKVSPFAMETFDLAKMPDEFLKTSVVKKIREVKVRVLFLDYMAKPDWHNCSFYEFRTICPDSYAY